MLKYSEASTQLHMIKKLNGNKKYTTEKVKQMTREDVINTMIDTVNDYNSKLMQEGGLTDEQIASAMVTQRPSLEGMFGLIYDELANKDVFK